MIYTTSYESPVGRLLLTAEGLALTGLWLDGQKYFAAGLSPELCERGDWPPLAAACAWLDHYFNGEKPTPGELTLAPQGSAFRRAVWKRLCAIPYGHTTTYGAIARDLAATMGREKMSAQAVGGAVGHNPIAIIIPCHRVIGVHGDLVGYGGGIERKLRLLNLENVNLMR